MPPKAIRLQLLSQLRNEAVNSRFVADSQAAAYTKAAFDATVRRLAEAVAPLPFDARQAIIAQIESNLQ